MNLRKLCVFAALCLITILTARSAVSAQDKETCAGTGWETIGIDEIGDVTGTYTATNNRDCSESAKWQYTATITIEKNEEKGQTGYVAQVYSREKKTPFRISGNQVRFTRDLAGSDKNKKPDQVWIGTLQRNRRTGSIRIYGTWSGAYDYVTDNTNFNHDFMIVIK